MIFDSGGSRFKGHIIVRKEGEPGNKAVMARDRGKIASFSGSPLHTHTQKAREENDKRQGEPGN